MDVEYLGLVLRKNVSLKILNLQGNQIGRFENDINVIIDSLKNNENLEILYLHGNIIDETSKNKIKYSNIKNIFY